MSLSGRSALRQKSSALLLNSLSSSTPPKLTTNTSHDSVPSNVPSNPSANRSAVWEDDPCPWEDEASNLSTNPTATIITTISASAQASGLPTPAQSSSSPAPPPNTAESLKAMAQKRITTFIYLKKAHEGKAHWFNTILLTRLELEKWFDHQRMQRRTTRFAVLGMSLSSLLDITTQQDFLRGLMNLLVEYETIPEDTYKPKMKGMFRNSKNPRKSASATDYPITLQESGDSSYLFTPNIPFDLDYFEVWITLCDILVEIYQKIIGFISHSSLSSPQTLNPPSFGNFGGGGSGGGGVPVTPTSSRPLSNSSSLNLGGGSSHKDSDGGLGQQAVDMITKIDGKIKKLIVVVTKEIDGIARSAIREELAQLDPMLSILNGGSWEG